MRQKHIDVKTYKVCDDPERIAPEWFTQAVVDGSIEIDRILEDGHIRVYGCTVKTKCGKLKARIGDYIVQYRNGMTVCRPEEFRERYE